MDEYEAVGFELEKKTRKIMDCVFQINSISEDRFPNLCLPQKS